MFLLRPHRWCLLNGIGFRRNLFLRNSFRTFFPRNLGSGMPYRTRLLGKVKLKFLAMHWRHFKNPQGYSQS